MDKRQITLTTEAQIEAFAQLERAVANDTDREYLPRAEIVRAAALAYVGRDGWDAVGSDDGRGGPPRTVTLEGG